MPNQNKMPEFGPSKFGDKRLDARFVKINEAFQNNPQAILAHVFYNSHQCKAAYRFFSNPQVSKDKIIKSHHKDLLEHLEDNDIKEILEIQDTTECDFSNHCKTTGLGRLGGEKSKRKGMECHTSLIVTTDGLALGIGSINLWSRTELKRNNKKNIRKIPLQEKESFKWFNALENFKTDNLQNLRRIIIADREADFYEFTDFIHSTDKKMVIRLRFDRKTEDGEMIKDALDRCEEIGRTKVTVKSKGGVKTCREEKEIDIALSYAKLVVCAPRNIDKTTIQNEKLKLTIVHAKEINPEDIENPIEWYLITNVEANTFEDILKIVRWYSYRWLIEEFHKILKAGIAIEKARLSEKARLEKLIAYLAVVGIKILWMTRINRIDPQAPIESVFDKEETAGLIAHAKKKGQKEIKTIDEAIKHIASLGGYRGRKLDGPPGLLTVWRGFIKYCDFLEGYLARE